MEKLFLFAYLYARHKECCEVLYQEFRSQKSIMSTEQKVNKQVSKHDNYVLREQWNKYNNHIVILSYSFIPFVSSNVCVHILCKF